MTPPSAPAPRWSTERIITAMLGTLVALTSAGMDMGATAPALDWLSIVELASAGAFFVLGVLGVLAVPRAGKVTRVAE